MAVPRDLSAPLPHRVSRRATLRHGDLSLEGSSRAGEETWFRVRPPGLALDVGRGPSALIGVSDVFLSHGHLDHASGLPLLLSQRSFQQLGGCRVLCPAPIVEPLRRFLEAAAALEATRFDFELAGLAPGDRVPLGDEFVLEAFATQHVVPSLGCHLFRRRRRLAADLRGASEEEIVALRRQGREVSEVREELALTYCGDTGRDVLASEPRLFSARILLLECTFLGAGTRGRGERFGHLHLDDLVASAASFENEVVVLHHLSARHPARDLRRELERRAPSLAARVVLFDEAEDAA